MARKSAVVEEPDDLELEEDDDLELEEDDDEEPAPAPKAKKTRKAPAATKADANGYGISWLVDHVKEATDTDTSPASLRVLLRKMAKDDSSPLSREVGEDRSRYSFTGENDKIVKAVVKAVKGGALTTARNDNLAAARAARKAKAEAGTAEPTKKTKATKSKAAKVEEAAPARATRRRKG